MAKRPKLSLKGLGRIFRWSIKGRIALAFTCMGVITVGLGIIAVKSADRSASLVRNTYDETVVATSYARAATTDFANMRASFAHEVLSPNSRRDLTKQMSAAMEASFQTDLSTAIEKSSADTHVIGDKVRKLAAEWIEASERMSAKPTGAAWDELERHARRVEEQLEDFVARVSDRGYAYRQEAEATTGRDIKLATSGVAVAIAMSGLVALMLYLRISAPIGTASRLARDIAAGTLDGDTPKAAADEIGDLIRAMVAMRKDVSGMMSEQVVLREQSQARVAEALDGSFEGVVIVDAQGAIQIANRRALDFLGLAREDIEAGLSIDDLLARMVRAGDSRAALLGMRGAAPETEETRLPDGRWIQNSRNRTTEGGLVALYTEVTAMRDQKDRLSEANATLDAALGNMVQGLCVFDADDRLKLANARFHALFDLADGALPPGTPFRDMVAWAVARAEKPTYSLERILRHEEAVILRRRSVSRSIVIGRRTFAVTQDPMPDGGWIATYEDVTERRRTEGQIAFLASHDALTRLPNRMTLTRRVEEAILRARPGVGFAVHVVNLDAFKQLNDTLGHVVGDQVLRGAADRLLASVGAGDTVARLGGDEFGILQADVSSAEEIVPLARLILEAVAAPYPIEGRSVVCGVSVGIALYPGDGQSHGQLLKNAEVALRKAKEEGRGTWRFFEAAMDRKLQIRRSLEIALRRAVDLQEFEVHYQPLLDVRSGRIGSFEALCRWRHPKRGLVSPDRFIPVAEETGLIREIGALVLRAACAEAVRWPARIRVAVNVSTIQLRDPGFVDLVTTTLEATGLPAEQLELEITESVLMTNHVKVLPILTALRSIGVRFAMDDFGTGYSSLSSLRAFAFDKIKIDRSFVRDLGADDAADQIVRTILALGHSLNMRVTAEGVENEDQKRLLAGMGCEEIQGYLIGRPEPADHVADLLARTDAEAARAPAAGRTGTAPGALRKRRAPAPAGRDSAVA